MSADLDATPERLVQRHAALEHASRCVQAQLEALHAELAWIEQQLSNSTPRRRIKQHPEGQLDATLSELDEQIERCEDERKMISRRLELGRHSQAAGERRLAMIGSEREVLLNLFVAGSQLREAADLERVRAAIIEIVVNLIGCEEVGLFERSGGPSNPCFRLSASLGLDATRSADLRVDQGFVGCCLANGEAVVSRTAPLSLANDRADGLSVCLPLRDHGEIVAVLLLFGLLEHKRGLAPLDLELLDLLRLHAGAALCQAPQLGSSEHDSTTWTQA